MFDLDYGIPIYSAYYVTKEQAGQFGAVNRTGGWRQDKGTAYSTIIIRPIKLLRKINEKYKT